MKDEGKRKREFYVYRVTTEENNQSENNNQEKGEDYLISPRYGRQVNQKPNEHMGYHRDPSTYDSIRPNATVNLNVFPSKGTPSSENEKIDNDNFEDVDPFMTNNNNSDDFESVNPFIVETPKKSQNSENIDSFNVKMPSTNYNMENEIDPFESRYPKQEGVRGEYIPIQEEKPVSIEDLPEDIFEDNFYVEVDEMNSFYEHSTPQKKQVQNTIKEEPKVVKTQININKPKISTKPNLDEISSKRNPVVDIPAPKLTKYIPPKLDLLTRGGNEGTDDRSEAERQKAIINQTLSDSGIKAHVIDYIFGPTVTQFMIKVEPGVNVNTINSCSANLAMYLEVERIRIQTPIPGKAYAGVEVPKKSEYRHIVHLGDILASKEYKENKCKIPIVVGCDNYGIPMICDIAEMPHCLVAGTTKSGKSVFLNTIILSLLYCFNPRDLRLVLVDPKRIELSPYEGIPHLAMPVITDNCDFPATIGWIYEEMEQRYKVFQYYGEQNFTELNKRLVEEKKSKLPYIVVIIDEFGDWFAGADATVAEQIKKIAAKARAAGIHVILATQRPTTESISGDIKSNFDTRIAFKVSNFVDSKVILDRGGAERLEGYGDMLIKYAGNTEKRLQGAFVGNTDIRKVINFLRENNTCNYIVTLEEVRQSTTSRQLAQNSARATGLDDPRFEEVAYYIVRNKNASNNSLSKEFGMGFNRVNDILISLEQLGVLSPAVKGKQREVLVNEIELEEILTNCDKF